MNKELFNNAEDLIAFRKSPSIRYKFEYEIDIPEKYPAVLVWDIGYRDVFDSSYVYPDDFSRGDDSERLNQILTAIKEYEEGKIDQSVLRTLLNFHAKECGVIE